MHWHNLMSTLATQATDLELLQLQTAVEHLLMQPSRMIARGGWTVPPDQPRQQQPSSMDWPSDQMSANELLRHHQTLSQQNRPIPPAGTGVGCN